MDPLPPPTPEPSFWQRQTATYHHDLAHWARMLNVPVPALAVALALVVLCSCSFWSVFVIDGLNAPSRADVARAAATQTASAPTATPGPTATPFPTFTPGPSPTPVPIATATPNYVVFQVSGNGNKSTDSFTVHGKWRLSWVCSGVGSVLSISIMNAATNDYAYGLDGADYTCPRDGGGDNSTYHRGGTFFLSIIADVDYTITVTDLSG